MGTDRALGVGVRLFSFFYGFLSHRKTLVASPWSGERAWMGSALLSKGPRGWALGMGVRLMGCWLKMDELRSAGCKSSSCTESRWWVGGL